MIQRIQSIFLLLAGITGLSLFLTPIASTEVPNDASMLFADASYNVQDHWSMMLAFGLGGALLLIAIFLFRNRKLQMNLTAIGLLSIVVGIAVVAWWFMQDAAKDLAEFQLTGISPVLTIILGIAAYFYINKDEKLVRSADRLR